MKGLEKNGKGWRECKDVHRIANCCTGNLSSCIAGDMIAMFLVCFVYIS